MTNHDEAAELTASYINLDDEIQVLIGRWQAGMMDFPVFRQRMLTLSDQIGPIQRRLQALGAPVAPTLERVAA